MTQLVKAPWWPEENIAGWVSASANAQEAPVEGGLFAGFNVDPLMLESSPVGPSYYPVGWLPVGMNTTGRSIINAGETNEWS